MVGLIGAIKGKRNADVPMKTLLNHLIIALLPALAAASIVLVIWLWTTAPSLVETAGVQEMGFAAEEAGASKEAAPADAGGLAEPEGSQAWRSPRPNRRRRRRLPPLNRRRRSPLPRRPRPHRLRQHRRRPDAIPPRWRSGSPSASSRWGR